MGFLDDLRSIVKDSEKRDETRVGMDFHMMHDMIDKIDDEDKLFDILMSVGSDPDEDEKYVTDVAVKKIMGGSKDKDLIMNASLYVVYTMKQNGYKPKYPLDLARLAAAIEAYEGL